MTEYKTIPPRKKAIPDAEWVCHLTLKDSDGVILELEATIADSYMAKSPGNLGYLLTQAAENAVERHQREGQ